MGVVFPGNQTTLKWLLITIPSSGQTVEMNKFVLWNLKHAENRMWLGGWKVWKVQCKVCCFIFPESKRLQDGQKCLTGCSFFPPLLFIYSFVCLFYFWNDSVIFEDYLSFEEVRFFYTGSQSGEAAWKHRRGHNLVCPEVEKILVYCLQKSPKLVCLTNWNSIILLFFPHFI